MAKHNTYQKFIYKIHSTRILSAKNKHLELSLQDARDGKEIISLADSSVLRFIDNLNGLDKTEIEQKIAEIRKKIKLIKRKPKSPENRREIKKCYNELDKLQFKPEYVSVIIDKASDFQKLNEGFYINGIRYLRFVGTPNGLKKQTVVYVCEENQNGIAMHQLLRQRLNNGRNINVPLVPAKYEAYQALACSSSHSVSQPKGILVVDDLILHFTDNVINLNDENSSEPIMVQHDEEVEVNDSDGYGLISPELAQQWSYDLGLNYMIPGACIRNSFMKGMCFTFDFHKFADTYAENKIVKDVWGTERNIDDIDIILTTSMLKLWSSYDNLEHYIQCCEKNQYTFSITKPCSDTLENERNLNYQFIQSYNLSDEQIDELIRPTISEIEDVISRDKNKTILFLKGTELQENNITGLENDFAKAIMIDERMMKDPYVISRINYVIKKRIDDAKIGVLKIHGNYAPISGDPFALCQKIFNIPIEPDKMGLLKAGEIYSQYWADRSIKKITCFRAPMTCHNNIRLMEVADNPDVREWYKYMRTVNILNCHDTFCAAENGADKDGDAIITTDNPILVNNTLNSPTIVCVQRNAKKELLTEDVLAMSNTQSFGSAIGAITNRVTTMYDVLAGVDPNSIEAETLRYRIMCGQLYQQNEIDKTKGIISDPMPKYWYSSDGLRIEDTDTNEIKANKEFNMRILANKKPYFMNYIYPEQKNEYNKHIKNANDKSLMQFAKTLDELINQEIHNKEEAEFIEWYYTKMPVGMNNCVMNRICWKIEKEFKNFVTDVKTSVDFDYTIMKSGVEYSKNDYKKIEQLHTEYTQRVRDYLKRSVNMRIDSEEATLQRVLLQQEFEKQCYMVCPNQEELCDILLDLCYSSPKSKQFVWEICGNVIIKNLLKLNNNKIAYPCRDENGEIIYCGDKFTLKEAIV